MRLRYSDDVKDTHLPTLQLRMVRETEWVSDNHARAKDRLQQLWMPIDSSPESDHLPEWIDVEIVRDFYGKWERVQNF